MELEGKVFKHKSFWLIDIPSLSLTTQGRTKQEAYNMIVDAVMELLNCYFPNSSDFEISVIEYDKNVFGLFCSDHKLLLSFLLKRQREERGVTVREAAGRLGSKSPNTYAQYEKGKKIFLSHSGKN